MYKPVKARRLRVIEVFVRVGSGEGAHADPAEVLHTASTGHLVTAIQLLVGGDTKQGGESRKGCRSQKQHHTPQSFVLSQGGLIHRQQTQTTTYAHKFALKVKYRNIEQVVLQLDTNTISSHK